MPFAVVGSDKEYQVNGKRVLGRKTPWGIIEGKKPLCSWELKVSVQGPVIGRVQTMCPMATFPSLL